MDVTIRRSAERSRFEAVRSDEVIGLADYVEHGGVVVLPHVEVRPDLRGNGIAARLTAAALDWIRASGLRALPQCPYAIAYLRRHPEYADLVD